MRRLWTGAFSRRYICIRGGVVNAIDEGGQLEHLGLQRRRVSGLWLVITRYSLCSMYRAKGE